MPEVPAHEKVHVQPSFLEDENHGEIDCTECHGGDPTGTTRAIAHVGMNPRGTVDCSECHEEIVTAAATSLHSTLNGMRRSMADRSGGLPLRDNLGKAFENHCSSCHATCGDCHVSVPKSAGGGLLSGHRFRKTPPMVTSCAACHGSRVSDEYRGNNEGLRADAHYFKGMQCADCHTGAEMHNTDTSTATHRYDVAGAPGCADCHPDDEAFGETPAHTLHREPDGTQKLSCQVCHSVSYKNCYSCHVSLDEDDKAIFEVNARTDYASVLDFKIGYNPKRDALHPAKYVTLRHVPVDPDNYAFYEGGLLTTFDAVPTWRLATPHNIQRITPQNETCEGCHGGGHRDLFLGPADLEPYEVDANADVVVPDEELPW